MITSEAFIGWIGGILFQFPEDEQFPASPQTGIVQILVHSFNKVTSESRCLNDDVAPPLGTIIPDCYLFTEKYKHIWLLQFLILFL
jgi:hypothetical protein